MSVSDVETADRLARRRARLMAVLAVYFIVSQGAVLANATGHEAGALRTVDWVRVGGWFAMAIALLALLMTGGGWFRDANVRAMVNDDSSKANRSKALGLGFFNAMATAILLYVLSLWTDFGAREAIHIIMTVGIASALLVFAAGERRDLADG